MMSIRKDKEKRMNRTRWKGKGFQAGYHSYIFLTLGTEPIPISDQLLFIFMEIQMLRDLLYATTLCRCRPRGDYRGASICSLVGVWCWIKYIFLKGMWVSSVASSEIRISDASGWGHSPWLVNWWLVAVVMFQLTDISEWGISIMV